VHLQELTVSTPPVYISTIPTQLGQVIINPPPYITIATCIIASSSSTFCFSLDSELTACNASETKEVVAVPSAYNDSHDHP
jgi:hypothetical protein